MYNTDFFECNVYIPVNIKITVHCIMCWCLQYPGSNPTMLVSSRIPPHKFHSPYYVLVSSTVPSHTGSTHPTMCWCHLQYPATQVPLTLLCAGVIYNTQPHRFHSPYYVLVSSTVPSHTGSTHPTMCWCHLQYPATQVPLTLLCAGVIYNTQPHRFHSPYYVLVSSIIPSHTGSTHPTMCWWCHLQYPATQVPLTLLCAGVIYSTQPHKFHSPYYVLVSSTVPSHTGSTHPTMCWCHLQYPATQVPLTLLCAGVIYNTQPHRFHSPYCVLVSSTRLAYL